MIVWNRLVRLLDLRRIEFGKVTSLNILSILPAPTIFVATFGSSVREISLRIFRFFQVSKNVTFYKTETTYVFYVF